MSILNQARVRSWETRRARYGPSGTPNLVKRRGYTGPRARPSDKVDAEGTALKMRLQDLERVYIATYTPRHNHTDQNAGT